MSSAKPKREGLLYRGHPLRRFGNLIYYGSMADPYVVMMQVLETTRIEETKKKTRTVPDAAKSETADAAAETGAENAAEAEVQPSAEGGGKAENVGEVLDLATKVSVQLQSTAVDVKAGERVLKKGEKESLYAAMDLAYIWLDRALKGKQDK